MPYKTGLGRGLDALIPGANDFAANIDVNASADGHITKNSVIELAVDQIRQNPRQPRLVLGQEKLHLEELAASIREHGVIQPLIVTRTQGPGLPYTLIAGERRWRASQLAGLTHVPVLIKDATPQEMLEIALIENIQRNDLSPLEEAAAYQQLINDFGLTQEEVAQRVGKSREVVANTVRLNKLPGKVQVALMQEQITEGHARALLTKGMTADMQIFALDDIIDRAMNVRQAEEYVRRLIAPQPKAQPKQEKWESQREYETKLRDALGTRVQLQRSRKGGKIVIDFYSDEEFSVLYDKLVRREE